MSRFYAKKILFNITQTDIDSMGIVMSHLKITQSELIRRAIRQFTAEQKVVVYMRGREGI